MVRAVLNCPGWTDALPRTGAAGPFLAAALRLEGETLYEALETALDPREDLFRLIAFVLPAEAWPTLLRLLEDRHQAKAGVPDPEARIPDWVHEYVRQRYPHWKRAWALLP